jgi:hypothetical protein
VLQWLFLSGWVSFYLKILEKNLEKNKGQMLHIPGVEIS